MIFVDLLQQQPLIVLVRYVLYHDCGPCIFIPLDLFEVKLIHRLIAH